MSDVPEGGLIELPDLNYIRARIPILEVARELRIYPQLMPGAAWTMAHCFRPENHKNGDRTPSLGFNTKTNKFMCFNCDGRTASNVDLVMAVEGFADVIEAARWFDEHYPGIPRKKVKTLRFDFRAGVDDFKNPDDLVRAGLVPHLTDSALRVFVVIAAFRDKNDISEVSYQTIMLRSGIASKSTVAKAIRHLEGLSIFECIRRRRRGRAGNEMTQYCFTFNDPKLFAILASRDLRKEGGLSTAPCVPRMGGFEYSNRCTGVT